MRFLLSFLWILISGIAAFGQKAVSGKAPVSTQPQPSVTWWFIIALMLLVAGLGYLFWRSGRGERGALFRRLGTTRARRSISEVNKRPQSGRAFPKRKTGFTDIQDRLPTDKNDLMAGVEKIPTAAEPEAVPQQENAPAPMTPETEPEVAPTAATTPEIFYMTVPAADGSFPVASKKRQPHGCLYVFEVAPENPLEARIRFAGNEADMRNAQAFRDLELLPACTFSNRPQENRFQFEQTEGRAFLDNEVWVIKEKIGIRFV